MKNSKKDKGEYIYANGTRLVHAHPMSLVKEKFSEHRRLKVFASKGCECVTCGILGEKFLQTIARNGDVHFDVYTTDNILMTIDHIIPKIEGGGDEIENLQPMCKPCNMLKGRTVDQDAVKVYLENKKR